MSIENNNLDKSEHLKDVSFETKLYYAYAPRINYKLTKRKIVIKKYFNSCFYYGFDKKLGKRLEEK